MNYSSNLPHSVRLATCWRCAPFSPPNNLSLSNLGSNCRSSALQTTEKSILRSLFLAPVLVPEAFSHNPNTIEFA
jgi:hypothetical protein